MIMKTYETLFEKLFAAKDYVSGAQLGEELGLSRTSIWKAIQHLEKEGLIIDSVKNRGYKLLSGDLLLPQHISNNSPIFVSYNPQSQSTQLDAKEGMQEGNEPNTLYLAPTQIQAQGRFGRPFYTPKQGGIYMSLHVRPNLPFDELPAYTVLTAASIYQAIKNLTGIETQIKWVNDLYLNGKKLAGVLTEAISSIETGLVTDVIIGVGLNFAITDFPDDLANKATSLFSGQTPFTRNDLIAEIWRIFYQTDEDTLIQIYKENSLILGKMVTFEKKNFTYTGKALALSNDGHLLIELTSGEQIWLTSGEVSLKSWEE
ncbi:bifunctional biotin--[acetyl-CoA-carboxylase] synthetase/biotin operon repressor [Streptococcus massiliensis]|uniref:Bifunctional ligase/repressor BirA n=2 Tax=Streptococcus massiliensis TaxID=313439 RepID=A0A380L0I8_9STRE|nr:bifunctional biotin--[acetyl-CoA-carboxylase] synthetase/biotin operon repressor [Streptococcus massiliensis]